MTATKYDTPEARWAGVGPYYAMFPARFADRVIETYTEKGDTIIDPFAGRGTSLFSAAIRGRHALGIEINPVGWVYAATKLGPSEKWRVEERVADLGRMSGRFRRSTKSMPEFFRWCFAPDVRAFLLAARKHLDWRRSVVDRTVMAILLIDLHGKRATALSNQMRQTKSMSPNYAVRWWRERKMRPPNRKPVDFVFKKLDWRYARGRPETSESRVYLSDSTHRIAGLRQIARRLAPNGARLLFTSPPYFGITNYHYDQWLRLWLLGGVPAPRSRGEKHRGKFEHQKHYRQLLLDAFSNAAESLAEDATVYVRTGTRRSTVTVTRDVLNEVFPRHRIRRKAQPVRGMTQTRLFGNGDPKSSEVDLILERR